MLSAFLMGTNNMVRCFQLKPINLEQKDGTRGNDLSRAGYLIFFKCVVGRAN